MSSLKYNLPIEFVHDLARLLHWKDYEQSQQTYLADALEAYYYPDSQKTAFVAQPDDHLYSADHDELETSAPELPDMPSIELIIPIIFGLLAVAYLVYLQLSDAQGGGLSKLVALFWISVAVHRIYHYVKGKSNEPK